MWDALSFAFQRPLIEFNFFSRYKEYLAKRVPPGVFTDADGTRSSALGFIPTSLQPREGVVQSHRRRPGIKSKRPRSLGGAISANQDLSIEVTRRLQRGWAWFGRYQMEIYDRPGVRLRLKVGLLKAGTI